MNDEPAWFAVNIYKEMESPDYIDTSKKLYAILGRYDLLDAWWRYPNKAFGMSPWEMWYEDKQRVIKYVDQKDMV